MKIQFIIAFGFISSLCKAQIIVIEENEIAAILTAHNKERSVLNIPDLEWSKQLAKESEKWALNLALDDNGLYHSNNDDYGENIALFYSNPPHFGVELWNEEKVDFRYGKSNVFEKVGHYTQVIWKNTTQVGCGCARGKSKAFYFVCKYNPPGNYIGVKPY